MPAEKSLAWQCNVIYHCFGDDDDGVRKSASQSRKVEGRFANPYEDKASVPCLSYANSELGTRKILKINFRKDFTRLGKYRRGLGGGDRLTARAGTLGAN